MGFVTYLQTLRIQWVMCWNRQDLINLMQLTAQLMRLPIGVFDDILLEPALEK